MTYAPWNQELYDKHTVQKGFPLIFQEQILLIGRHIISLFPIQQRLHQIAPIRYHIFVTRCIQAQ